MALIQISLTLKYTRRKFYYQQYIHIWTLFSMLLKWISYLLLYLLTTNFELNFNILPKSCCIHLINNSFFILDKIGPTSGQAVCLKTGKTGGAGFDPRSCLSIQLLWVFRVFFRNLSKYALGSPRKAPTESNSSVGPNPTCGLLT